jgi:hypothetical protein
MKKGRQSSNVQDYRDPGKAAMLSSYNGSDRGRAMSTLTQAVTSQIGPSVQSRQNARALGLEGQLADLQNTANKLKARRRTRMDSVYRGMLSGK